MTSIPDPVPGLVIRYSYLWLEDHKRGREEGSKDRPCVVVLAIRRAGGHTIVSVAPITHRPPAPNSHAIEIPAQTKSRLGLDESQSWIVTNELNEFQWPGPDIRPVTARRFAYALIPRGLFEEVRTAIVSHLKEHGLKIALRT